MKRFTLFMMGILLCASGFAQDPSQNDKAVGQQQPVIQIEKGGILKDMKMIANTRFSSTNNFADGSFQNSALRLNELRMEVVGKVSDRLSFRFRDTYSNRSVDNTPTTDGARYSVDLAFMEYEVSPKLSVAAGKMNGDWGSYEFDINPIYMYAYNHLTNNPSTLFLGGAYLRWKAMDNHTFTFQLTNSSSRPLAQRDNGRIPVGVEETKAFMGQTVNWRGSFMDNQFTTLWSLSHFTMAKSKQTYLLQMGNQYKTDKLVLQYDFKYSNDQLDRLGYTSGLVSVANNGFIAMDVSYMEHWLRAQYSFSDRWSATLIGMTNTQYWKGDRPNAIDFNRNNTLGTSYSYTVGVEYNVYKPYNLQAFASFVGRYNQYTDYAIQQLGLSNNNTGQIFVGIICPLRFF